MNYKLEPHLQQIVNKMTYIYDNVTLSYDILPIKLDIPSFYKVFFTYLKHNRERYQSEIADILTYIMSHKMKLDAQFIFTKNPTLKQLQNLHYYIEDNYKVIKTNFLYTALNSTNNLNIPIKHNYLYNTFITFDSFEKLKKQIKFEIIINYSLDNLNGKVTFYSKTKSINLQTIKEIVSRLLFLNKYTNSTRLPEFIIYASDLKKKLIFDTNNYSKNKEKVIRENNVNTAATDAHSKIIIWRKEELMKSIFHETVHFHTLDIINSSQKIKVYLQEHLNIAPRTQILVREGYTEFITNILNILFTIRNDYTYNKFTEYLEREKQFSIKQIGIILSYFNYKSFADFLKLENYKKNKNALVFKQTTSCICYYIIKSLFLFNMETIFANNLISNMFLKYHNVQTNDSLLTIIETTINKNNYMKIKSSNDWIKQINKTLKRKKTNKNLKLKKTNKKQSSFSMKMTTI